MNQALTPTQRRRLYNMARLALRADRGNRFLLTLWKRLPDDSPKGRALRARIEERIASQS